MVIVERVPGSAFPQVVRVHVRSHDPDFDLPWASTPYEDVGVAVVIGDRTLLCLASLVLDAVPWEGTVGADQAVARIAAIDHDRDLALLEVAGSIADVWGITPIELGALPPIGDVVLLAGYSEDEPAQRQGHAIVGDIGLVRYAHSQRHLLAATIDARQPFSDGGDVVLRSGTLVGLVMQRERDEPLRGDVIAPEIIRAFLAGRERGAPPGVPALGIGFQVPTNPALRATLGLGERDGGILVTRVEHGGTGDGVLEVRDVLLAIDGAPIADDGTVEYAGRALRHYAVLCDRTVGERARLRVRRAGQVRELEVTLRPLQALVPRVRTGPPAYAVFAGLVLQPLSRDFLRTWEDWWNNGPKEFLHAYYLGQRTAEQHEVVAITSILEDPINEGYGDFHNESIVRVNGVVPRGLSELVAILDAATGTIVIETSTNGLIVFDAAEARAATARMCSERGIPSSYSLTVADAETSLSMRT